MGRRLSALLAVLAISMVAVGSIGIASKASAQAEVFHVTMTHAVVPGFDVDRCDGHPVSLTLYFNGPLHSTDTPNGHSLFHVTNAGRFEAVSLDPAFEDESGRFTVHITDNGNSAGQDLVFTMRVKGESTSGQPMQWNIAAKAFFDAEGEPQVLFDRVVNCS